MRIRFSPPKRHLMAELDTERFHLRPATLFEILPDPGKWRTTEHIYRGIYAQKRPMTFVKWLRSGPFPDQQTRFTSAIVPRGETRPIGYHLVRLYQPRSASFSVGIHDEAWLGKDVAVETRKALMNHFFQHGVERFTARIRGTNFASVFTYRKLGFAHVGTLHREGWDIDTGAPVDFLLFEMLKENWMHFDKPEPAK